MSGLGHVLWIGGPAASGKTTVARALARRYGLRWYNSDAMTWSHRDRALAAGSSAARRWEDWRAAPPELRPVLSRPEMVALSLHRERGPMTLADLRALPASPLIVAEGTQITPRIVPPDAPAVWLMPSVPVQRGRWERKHGPDGLSEWALAVGGAIRAEVQESGVRALVVDGMSPQQTVEAVHALFAEAIEAGSRATTAVGRRVLLRYANAAMLEQSRAFLNRSWAGGEAAMSVRSFLCECADPDCQAEVRLPITDFPLNGDPISEPVLAHEHGAER